MGALELISVGLGFYPVCKVRHAQFFTWAFLEEVVELGNSNGTDTITGSSTGRNGKELKYALVSTCLTTQIPTFQ